MEAQQEHNQIKPHVWQAPKGRSRHEEEEDGEGSTRPAKSERRNVYKDTKHTFQLPTTTPSQRGIRSSPPTVDAPCGKSVVSSRSCWVVIDSVLNNQNFE